MAKSIQSIPVVRASTRGYELAALVGDDAVILGWTMDDYIDRSDLLGFGIKRRRRHPAMQQDADCQWLPNHRRFAFHDSDACSTDAQYSTQSDPLQQFYFLDYAVEPGFTYTYSVVPIRGTPTLKYFEEPISVTLQALRTRPDGFDAVRVTDARLTMTGRYPRANGHAADTASGCHEFMSCPHSVHQRRTLDATQLAALVTAHTDQARSAVFQYSAVPLPDPVRAVVEQVNSGRLLYGVAPRRDRLPPRHNTVLLSTPASRDDLRHLAFSDSVGPRRGVYSSAIVTDPWSRSPQILLWTEIRHASAPAEFDTLLIKRDKRSAASLATCIFQAYTAGRLPSVQRNADRGTARRVRNLEPDGRWSNIYFSKQAASHKYREREIFSGHP